ncbi:MBL fold metallo-hydrolase [Leeuwenhoekiella sp. UBA6783]|uniref:MBL fold metallo-hydrolase n=1 Tax=Leeuwenhoekiella sp. UBA6783 TaxID=1946747 RepID=UPI0025C29C3F|nr:MBL fold metallo-hydrolase [Leeuwenhoekiella sp. UBA6783]|tara:strand:- start:958 stop:1872 length:915 start_codon:yes stop_codon:yes gene_type:complete
MRKLKSKYLLLSFLMVVAGVHAQKQMEELYTPALLSQLRKKANEVEGAKPSALRYIKFAESPRTWSATLEGGDETPYMQARTAYQLMYDDHFIMIDSGMDLEVHKFFGHGTSQPYFQQKNIQIQKALKAADQIIITHEHGDHIAGVLRTLNYSAIAPKTVVTTEQLQTLVNNPQMEALKISPAQIDDFNTVDFEETLAIAPGVVLIKAPGHTPGELMIYLQFEDGREYIITGDVSWSYAGVLETKQKPQSQQERIGENPVQIQFELDWLNEVEKQGIQLIVNHDDIVQPKLVKQGILKEGLLLK